MGKGKALEPVQSLVVHSLQDPALQHCRQVQAHKLQAAHLHKHLFKQIKAAKERNMVDSTGDMSGDGTAVVFVVCPT
jgi:hypothetical protein